MKATQRGPLVSAGILLGAGLGGFVDGIALHQILLWHHMLSSVRPATDLVSVEYNMVWDGFFHAGTWIVTSLGLFQLWRAGTRSDVPWSARTFIGSLALGAGLFDFVEGMIDHQILGVHHVHPGRGQLAWDLGFLALGLALMTVGWALIRAGRDDVASRGLPVRGKKR